ncbi:MAG: hypothetical protein E7773_09115 [Sphingomonas sp.]|uniref:hypothetical protein n=1 Tax=Sphingomonas sp. TaxID=28214 RepID=UPI0012169F37|nr:hypothetical protein [Sphingomonas sp.]THD36085.1 MAG: hypothetical protein E7773_09115 [Sphingomonas sp.]
MMLGALLGLLLALRVAEGTPIGRTLQLWLLERPASRLSRISRGHLLLFLTIAGVAVGLIWLLENDGRMLVAMGLPDVVGLAMTIDAASLIDLALVAVIAASAIRVRAVVGWVHQRAALRRPRTRTVRTRRAKPPANDDEDRPALAA